MLDLEPHCRYRLVPNCLRGTFASLHRLLSESLHDKIGRHLVHMNKDTHQKLCVIN